MPPFIFVDLLDSFSIRMERYVRNIIFYVFSLLNSNIFRRVGDCKKMFPHATLKLLSYFLVCTRMLIAGVSANYTAFSAIKDASRIIVRWIFLTSLLYNDVFQITSCVSHSLLKINNSFMKLLGRTKVFLPTTSCKFSSENEKKRICMLVHVSVWLFGKTAWRYLWIWTFTRREQAKNFFLRSWNVAVVIG